MSDLYPNVLFHELILNSFEKHGDDIALIQDDQKVTFTELSKYVSKLVYVLVELGVTQGDTVMICLPNSIWYPIVFLATAKIGAILCGVSSESVESELKYCLNESEAKYIFTNSTTIQHNEHLLNNITTIIVPTDVHKYFDEIPNVVSELSVTGRNIDSVLLAPFSSGTTGPPKCCQLTHRNFLASTFSLKKFIFDDLLKQSSKKTLAFLPFHHASGFWALLLCLLEGCTSVIMAEFHPMVMMDLIEKYQIDTINIVPAIANGFLKIGFIQDRCPTLRTILCGSSGLNKESCKRFLALFPQVKHFLQGYGMTELVVLSHITPLNDNFAHLGSCGMLLPGFDSKIVVGEEGESELYLKSDSIMKQYKNGLKNVDEDGWLQTGDVVKQEGEFYYIVDRKKDLIKVNGFQVSPTEIENIVQTFPQVNEVAVVGIDDELCGQLPKLYIVLVEGTNEFLFLKHLEHTLKEKLSSVKQPRGGVCIIPSMPKSSSGKIQKNKLLLI